MSKTTVTALEKSLVERVSALSASEGGSHRSSGATVPTRPGPEHPVTDGYMRLSPVQPLYRAENYYRRLTWKCIGATIAIFIVISVAIFIFRK